MSFSPAKVPLALGRRCTLEGKHSPGGSPPSPSREYIQRVRKVDVMPETIVEQAAADWTCSRCEVTVSWMADVERPELPANWIREDGELYCLICRRERAGEAALLGLAGDATAKRRQQVETRARVEFELKRRPEGDDGRIAKACHTSVAAVRKERVRLGLQSRRPV
jgi:hypothetical protein